MQTPWMQTFSGKAYFFQTPLAAQVSIKDVAQSLANQCRFAGHCLRFYSVAEHSLYLSRVVRPDLARLALLHDAHEAYVHDVMKPFKAVLGEPYRERARSAWMAVAERFDLPDNLPGEIRTADIRMLATEQVYLMANPPMPWDIQGVEPYTLQALGLESPRQFGLPPREAHRRFLERFAELSA